MSQASEPRCRSLTARQDGRLAALPPAKAGMIAFLVSEASFFGTLIMAYVYFSESDARGRSQAEPGFLSAHRCLPHRLVSFRAARRFIWRKKPSVATATRLFSCWWGLTIVLGALFLLGTMWEWSDLIGKWGLTISRNLFGTSISLWSVFMPCT